MVRLLSGARMTFLIDDQITACGQDLKMAMARASCTTLLLAALRMYMGLPKCQLKPRYGAAVLGMEVETDQADVDGTRHCRFLLPSRKLAKLQAAGDELMASTEWTPRQLASIGGQLVFAYLAVYLAPLFVKMVHLMLVGKLRWEQGLAAAELPEGLQRQLAWDQPFLPSQLARQQLTFVLESVQQHNGRRFFKRPVTLTVAVDYSSVHGHGAFVVDGSADPADQMLVALTEEELQAIWEGRLSSTLGELKAKKAVTTWLLGHHKWSQLLRHGHLRFEGDNQAAVTVLGRCGGNMENFPVVKEIYM